jgi:hypothetical protein
MTTSDSIVTRIQEVAANANFGKPSAAKRGRNPKWPYVPVIDHGEVKIGRHQTWTEQLRGLAFATRDEAISCAATHIANRRADLASKLADPRYRALRGQYGLPEEIFQRKYEAV